MRFFVCLFLAGCTASSTVPGMEPVAPRAHDREPTLVELARTSPADDQRPLLVVFPRHACSASASMVLVDENATFLGAVTPGTAALLSVKKDTRRVFAVSSVDVYAAPTRWLARYRLELPPAPSGVLFDTVRPSTRECGNGQYAKPTIASKEQLENALAENDVSWLAPRTLEGQAWLDAHRERVRELLQR